MNIRAGVVGLGFMGRKYVHFLGQLEGIEVAAVCDVRKDVAVDIANTAGARSFTDPLELARSGDVDVVFVCTPEDQHEAVALVAIEAGKPVMIEKPLAHTLEAARAIMEAARATGSLVMVGHLLRFEPRWAAAHRVIAAGDIGDVLSITTRRVGNVLDQTVLGGRTTIPLYYGVHDLDIVRWFAGSEASTIYASRRCGALQQLGYPIDDLYLAILQFQNNVLANAELGWHVPASAVNAPTSGITVVGSKGWLKVEQADVGLQYWAESGRSGVHPVIDTAFWPTVHGVPGGALATELSHFLDCVRHDAEPIITQDDAYEALRLSLAMETSATRGSVVHLSEFA